jgi:hypothetical protein
MTNNIKQLAHWVKVNHAINEYRLNYVVFSFVVELEDGYHLFNAGINGGIFADKDTAKKAAETYWEEQNVGI